MAEAPCSPGYQQVSAHQAGVQDSECGGVLVCSAFSQVPLLTLRGQPGGKWQ